MATTLSAYLDQQAGHLAQYPEMASVLIGIADSCREISDLLRQAPINDLLGEEGEVNVQGEDQKKLDVISNDQFFAMMESQPAIAAMASEEMDNSVPNRSANDDANLLVIFDPLDGSSNLAANLCVGSIFSVVPFSGTHVPTDADFLRPGTEQVAAGYAMYGPATQLYLTVGAGTVLFALGADGGWYLTDDNVQIPETAEYAINHSNRRFWPAPISRYIDDCQLGKTGPLGRDYNTRWVAAMVAEASRIFTRGGVFLYPQDNKDKTKKGRIRMLYEACPAAMLIEQAGGVCTDGQRRMMEIIPESLHERIGVVFGSRREVETVAQYYADHQVDA